MISWRWVGLAVAGLVLAGCHYDLDSVQLRAGDSAPPPDSQRVDGKPLPPDSLPPDTLPPPGDGCAVGTPNHCAKCDHRCAGPDNAGTLRVCAGGKCSIQCRGAYYDVNGKTTDGCEVLDKLALHSVASTAKHLGFVTDCAKDQSLQVVIPSDVRHHVLAPHTRPAGTPKWFKLNITDKTTCVLDARVQVNLKGMSSLTYYRVETHFKCKSGKYLGTTIKTFKGGTAQWIITKTDCPNTTNDSGELFFRINQQTGTTYHHTKAPLVLVVSP